MKGKKESAKRPKPRHVWAINPKTRVKESRKRYNRRKARKVERGWKEDFSD